MMISPDTNYEHDLKGKTQQKSRDFDAALDLLRKLVYSCGGSFGGYETHTYTFADGKVLAESEHTFSRSRGDLPVCRRLPLTREEFIDGLKDIHIGEWKRSYEDPYVMDGRKWELEMFFDGGRRPVKIRGTNAYPYNFDVLLDLLGMFDEISEER